MGHVIKKQVLDIGVRQSEAFEVQHAVSHWYWNHLRPLLERAFDELAPSDEVIQIDRLEINLGHIDPSSFQDPNWTAAMELTLLEELKKAIRDQSATDNNVWKQSPVLQAGTQWLYYMKHGLLPWNLAGIPSGWWQQVLQALATDIACIEELRRLVIGQRSVLLRIIRQHDNIFITSLIKVLTARQQPEMQELMEELLFLYRHVQPVPKKMITLSLLREQWLSEILLDASQEGTGFDLTKTLLRIIQRNREAQQVHLITDEKIMSKTPLLHAALEAFLKISPAGKEQRSAINEITYKPDQPADPTEEPALQDDGNNKVLDGLYTELAGLVLLHPFLNILFTQLSWADQGNFRNKACQQQAIGLLHFLATGQTAAPEYALVIPKLLCGYPLKEPVPMDFAFSPDEQEEALHLLSVVIERWDVLKRTSIAGLREGFLQRMGKLTEQETGFLLQVENGSIDILLDQLPWGIGMIKLPWMKTLLRVDWR